MCKKMLFELGERRIISELSSLISPDIRLLDGIGHDSAFIDIDVSDDEIILLNTDRSGISIATKLGLCDGAGTGDFAVSHAVSDIYASGGTPVALSLAMLLPPDLSLDFAKEVMRGINSAALKYGAFIASGDTKENSKFAIVVTAVGKCKKDQRLTRSGANPGDLIVSTGNFGKMLSGIISHKKHLSLSDEIQQDLDNAMIWQNPPWKLSSEVSKLKCANACTDNSDGLSGTLYSLCDSSGVGAVLFKENIPISNSVKYVAESIGVDPFQLVLGNGDWQHIYAVPEERLCDIMSVSSSIGSDLYVIGKFTNKPYVTISENGSEHILRRIENNRFGGGLSFFDILSSDITYRGEPISNV